MSSRLQNVLLTRNAYDWQFGGAEKLTLFMAQSLRDNQIRPVVASKVPELVAGCRESKIPVFKNVWLKNETHRRWMLPYYLLSPILVLQYLWLILRYRIDIVMLASRDDQIFGTIAAVLSGRPVVWLDHGDMKGITSHKFRFLRKGYYWALRRADRIVTVSDYELSVISKNLPTEILSKFSVIGNGSTRRPSRKMEKPAGTTLIAFAGRLEREKGIIDLVEAAAIVCKQNPRIVFWLTGKGRAEKEVRRFIADNKLEDNVRLLGHLDNVFDALDVADIFVHPSHHDAGAPPLSVAEALLAGLPVIASNVGGLPEVIDATCGRLVPVSQPEDLAKVILDLASQPKKLAELSKGAREKAPSVDFANIVRDQYVPLLQEVIND